MVKNYGFIDVKNVDIYSWIDNEEGNEGLKMLYMDAWNYLQDTRGKIIDIEEWTTETTFRRDAESILRETMHDIYSKSLKK